ncbi:DSCC1 [Cordylochernes scorpioides]|uniref:Sister chromatid cohesion protein DCC1 n=1 Tax=Cordylochernes scorpioides TaxID=51811 RepID=A0ABY6LLC7_9ARAC|nr:DSCC1 [Cordylochernes scorpioides]
MPDSIRLLEVSPALLSALQAGNERLVIRGDPSDSAVLCTPDQTFDIKEAETSNSLLILPQLHIPEKGNKESGPPAVVVRKVTNTKAVVQVLGIAHSYLEVRPCQPRLSRIREILSDDLYFGPEFELGNTRPKYSTDDLLNLVQASSAQIEAELAKIHACLIDGHWRLLETQYHQKVLQFLMDLVDSNSWPLDQVPRSRILDTLVDLVPRCVLEHLLMWYAEPTGATDDSGDVLFRLKAPEICQNYGEALLQTTKKCQLQEFMEHWQRTVPPGLIVDLAHLRGVGLQDLSSRPPTICYLPCWDLPEDVALRFKCLFQFREKWTLEDISPYLEPVVTPTQSVSALLTKHARASVHNGIKMYSSRHPIS